ncbi:GLPGLI family protein [Elizabethkingia ursingii]|uniref:GLPGLI family protein n=1 Tax=Elizabethkingia ursingii TaxID=1756150 RepID=A0ABX3N7D6_9FLAO|nr:GLPGLI family protein [Elizabethkingia ursingii]OPB84435.1 hypothetical protein BB021_16975 [Elizabethkingia ursingii]
MRKLLIFLFISITISFNAQISGDFSFPPTEYKAENLDNSVQNFYYQLSSVRDKSNPQNKQEAICALEIGSKFSKFTELNTLKIDSLMEKFSHLNAVRAKEVNEMLRYKVKWKIVLVKDLIKKTNIFQNQFRETYQYEEQQPSFNWKLEKGTKDILGHKCNKAITEYRGRKYTAWYATDIPINNGPYVFQGLPGLIMELEDGNKEYHFVVVAIDKNTKPIYLRNESKILKVTRDQLRKVEKTYYDNPGQFIKGKAYNQDGSPMQVKLKSEPYNPIELE